MNKSFKMSVNLRVSKILSQQVNWYFDPFEQLNNKMDELTVSPLDVIQQIGAPLIFLFRSAVL